MPEYTKVSITVETSAGGTTYTFPKCDSLTFGTEFDDNHYDWNYLEIQPPQPDLPWKLMFTPRKGDDGTYGTGIPDKLATLTQENAELKRIISDYQKASRALELKEV